MGTKRNGMPRRSGSQTFSDPDCTSGSEVSCDTVIYMGRKGPTFSDGELTDSERQSAASSSLASVRLTVSSGVRQSVPNDYNVTPAGCGRQNFAERPLPPTPSKTIASPRHQSVNAADPGGNALPSSSGCGSPAHMSRKAHHKGSKSPMITRHKLDQLKGLQELWVDGPVVQHAGVEPYRAWENELTISPAVLAPVAQQQMYGHLRHMKEMSGTSSSKFPVRGQSELWIDGPKEFCVPTAEPSRQGDANWVSGAAGKWGRDTPQYYMASQQSAELSADVYPAGPTNSRQLHVGSGESTKDVELPSHSRADKVHGTPVKSFVKDWVAKHSHLSQIEEQPGGVCPDGPSSRVHTPKMVRSQPASPALHKARTTPSPSPSPRDATSCNTRTMIDDMGTSMIPADTKSLTVQQQQFLAPAEASLLASTESVYEHEVEQCLADVSFATTFSSEEDGTFTRSSSQIKRPMEPVGDERRDIHIYEEIDFKPASSTNVPYEGDCADFSSLQYQSTPIKNVTRPSCLRRPDGASNPNLVSNQAAKSAEEKSTAVGNQAAAGSIMSATSTSSGRQLATATGQSTVNDSSFVNSVACPRPPAKTGIFSKVLSKKSSPIKSPEKQSSSNSIQSSKPFSSSTPLKTAPNNSSSSKADKLSCSKVLSDVSKNGSNSSKKSGCVKSPVSFSDSPAISARSKSATSTRLPLSVDGGRKGKEQGSPTKSSSSSGRDSKGGGGGNTEKSGKEKSKGLGGSRKERKVTHSTSDGRDSDSGNDSGIVQMEVRLQSPYAMVTMPRLSQHSTSSGRGSDNSSTFSGQAVATEVSEPSAGHKTDFSSGYESMLHDGEVTGTSSSNESSMSDHAHGSRLHKKKSSSGMNFNAICIHVLIICR